MHIASVCHIISLGYSSADVHVVASSLLKQDEDMFLQSRVRSMSSRPLGRIELCKAKLIFLCGHNLIRQNPIRDLTATSQSEVGKEGTCGSRGLPNLRIVELGRKIYKTEKTQLNSTEPDMNEKEVWKWSKMLGKGVRVPILGHSFSVANRRVQGKGALRCLAVRESPRLHLACAHQLGFQHE